ncbi:MAG: M20/M25/M40 family metallo-hydrolase [Polyangiaceae bacterium]
MPGESFSGPALKASVRENQLSEDLSRDVHTLSVEIGERNLDHPEALQDALQMVHDSFFADGLKLTTQSFDVDAKPASNFEGEKKGTTRASEIVVVGAHYDSVTGSPGADDNASGVAALLAIARALQSEHFARTIRFVAFVNEEPPYFWHDSMGSLYYARSCKTDHDDVVEMISLESMGYFSDDEDSQKYPFPLGLFYPSKGNFIAFVGNTSSRDSVRNAIGTFRDSARVGSEGGVYPGFLPGIGWSDQWAFWQTGYPGIMITDTAPFRNPNYHTQKDLPPALDFDRFAREVEGVIDVVRSFANP